MSKWIDGLNEETVMRYKDSMIILVLAPMVYPRRFENDAFKNATPLSDGRLLKFLEPPEVTEGQVVPTWLRPLFLEQFEKEIVVMRIRRAELVEKMLAVTKETLQTITLEDLSRLPIIHSFEDRQGFKTFLSRLAIPPIP